VRSNLVLEVAEFLGLGSSALPFLGRANLWIEDSLEDSASIGLVQGLVQKALDGTSSGQLEIIVFDDGLSGLAAPFEALNSGGEKLLRTLTDLDDFKPVLRYLRNHIQGVRRVIQGLAQGLVEFRRAVNYPVEGYKVVVVSTDVSLLDEEAQNHLSVLLRAGPSAGVSFIIHSMTLGVNPFLVGMCENYRIKNGTIVGQRGAAIRDWHQPNASNLIATAQRVASSLASSAIQPIPFNVIQQTDYTWTDSSANGITFSVGRFGLSTVEITLGDELNQRHNMLITGAVGQGKSNLISVVIHSLCQRYSPSELELYLLDFKEGVTLKRFGGDAEEGYLPHARVLGLEADREFGLGVLKHLFETYRERMRVFKNSGVQDIRHYREAFPDVVMPRIILIVDEFQMMFADRDRVSDEIGDLLVRGVRLFRASGIHVVLASQTIGGNLSLLGSAGEALYAQVPVRIALKNSLAESFATLGIKNDAAAHLRAREAIVNLDYGELSSNRKTSIGFADEEMLAPLRHYWWTRGMEDFGRPYVFEGEKPRSLFDDLDILGAEVSLQGRVPSLMLGCRIGVDGRPLLVSFGREVGRNLAVLGGREALTELLSAALALGIQGSLAVRFAIIDGHDPNDSSRVLVEAFMDAVKVEGCACDLYEKSAAAECLESEESRIGLGPVETETYVLCLGFDGIRELPSSFGVLCRQGAVSGVHIMGWWRKLDVFRDQVGYGGDAYFDTKVATRLDSQGAKQFFNDPLLDWRSRTNRAIVWDSMEMDRATVVVPYSVEGWMAVSQKHG
jgi:hypothetical protein